MKLANRGVCRVFDHKALHLNVLCCKILQHRVLEKPKWTQGGASLTLVGGGRRSQMVRIMPAGGSVIGGGQRVCDIQRARRWL